ncbi:MAG: hypothetical protein PHN51_10130 [Candidatus Nanopelagicales bacterium]|nr:hypothetical protein [Candidatus Nanopelagicales bacterium]
MIKIETENYQFVGKDIFFLLVICGTYGLMLATLYLLSGLAAERLLAESSDIETFQKVWAVLVIAAVVLVQFLTSAVGAIFHQFKKKPHER